MKCLDFSDAMTLECRTPEEETHLQQCPVCKMRWDALASERQMIEEGLDPASEAEASEPIPPTATKLAHNQFELVKDYFFSSEKKRPL